MKLGFVSAILPERSGDEVIRFAAAEGFDCVEIMCWPRGRADRRYAGVTHLDVTTFTPGNARRLADLLAASNVTLSALGYYPNPLAPDAKVAAAAVAHLKKVIRAAALLEVNLVTTFVGRDWTKSTADNWPRFRKVWRPLIEYAGDQGVRIAIENCPMLFTKDEWPGGKNLASTPAVWRQMFAEIPHKNFGLNYDPSHLVWQQIDYLRPLAEFAERIFHVHAKDVRVDHERLADVGILALPSEIHKPKLPGLGDVHWGHFFSVLNESGYAGPVCIEVEDRAYEDTSARRQDAVRQSGAFLRNFLPRPKAYV